jgi:uncharacterized protein (TIRG00374 family)
MQNNPETERKNTNHQLLRVKRAINEHGLWATAVLTVIVFISMLVFADADRVLRAFADFEWSAFVAILWLATVSYLFRFLKWSLFLCELDINIPTHTSLVVFFSGLMMVVTPGKAGEVWKAWFLNDLEGVPISQTTSVVGAERITDLIALGAMALVGVVVFSRSATVLVVLGVAVVLGIGLLQWRSFCLRILASAESIPLISAYVAQLEKFYEATYALFQFRPLVVATVLSVFAWGLEGVALWLALAGFGYDTAIFVGIFVFGFASVVGAISMLPGGLLAAEASMVGLLISFGYSRSVAVSATVVIRVGTLWYAAILGFVIFASYKFISSKLVNSTVS